jgi:hypothetical protein
MRGFKTFREVYIISAALGWAAIIMASATVVGATDFQKLLPILIGGAGYFLILVPGAYDMWQRRKSNHLQQ